jgi:hypothetical protein
MTNKTFLRPARVHFARAVGSCAAIACFAGAPAARAATEFNPYASIDFQHNSNVFAVAGDEPLSAGRASRADNFAHYLAGAVADVKWGSDILALNIEGGRYAYQRDTVLNHYDFKFGGTFDWRLNPVMSGELAYEQARIMTPTAQTLAQQLELQTDKNANGTFRFLLTPRWRLDLHPIWHTLDSPLPAYPDFGYKETTGQATINYLGIQKLTAGLRGEYVDGSFHHIIAATKYTQKTAGLTANYAVTGFSSFDMQAGYTWRNSSLVNPAEADAVQVAQTGLLGSTKAFTGSLGATRRFTVKTSVDLKVFREVGSYVASANPEISTGAEAALSWKPDVRFGFLLRYRLAKEVINGPQFTLGQNLTNRDDRTNDVQGSLTYQAAKWWSLRAYTEYQRRTSNLQQANFNTTLFGITATVQLNEKLNQAQ